MSQKPTFRRKQLLVHWGVQGGLLLRLVSYGICAFVTVNVMLIAYRIVFNGPARPFYTHFDDLWFQYSPIVVALGLIVPLMCYDALRFSNRFAGPIFRLRNEMKRLTAGEPMKPLRFRKCDYWQELADEFNHLSVALQEARRELAELRTQAMEQAGPPVSPTTADEPELACSAGGLQPGRLS